MTRLKATLFRQFAVSTLRRLVCLCAVLSLALRGADAEVNLSAPEILPEGTILYVEISPWKNWAADFSRTALAQIAAEPDVRAFCAGPFASLSKVFQTAAPQGTAPEKTLPPAVAAPADAGVVPPRTRELAGAFFSMMQQFAPGPYTAAVRYSAEDEAAKRAPAWAAILGVNDEKQIENKNKNILALLDSILRDAKIDIVAVTDYQGGKLLTVKYADGKAGLTLVLHKNRLIASNDLEFAKQIMDGMAGTLTRKLSQNATFKSTGLTGNEHLSAYLDIAGMKKALGTVDKNSEGRLGEIFSLAGLDRAGTVAWSLKMEGPAFASRTAIFTGGERSGLLGALDAEPLGPSALKIIPANASFAAGFRTRKDRVLPLMRAAFKAAQGEKGAESFDEAVKQLHVDGAGFDDVLRDAFGGEFVVTSLSGSDFNGSGTLVPSFAASLSVDDPKKAEDALTRLLKKMAEKISPDGSALKEAEGTGIRYLAATGAAGLGVTPAFVFHDNHLLIAFDVPSLKKVLRLSREGGGLSSSEKFKTALSGVGGKMGSMFSYIDYAYLFKSGYGMTTAAVRLAVPADMLKAAGVDLNLLPDSDAVAQHLFPAMTIGQVTASGIVLTSRSPLPSAEVLTPPMAAISAIYASFAGNKQAER